MSASKDVKYIKLVQDILDNEEFSKMGEVKHHDSNRLDHSLKVSYYSYKIARKLHLDYKSVARGGLLHDFFLERTVDYKKVKDKVKLYAKYLGVDEDRIADEFNDFLFEKTSKISVNDVKRIKEEKKKQEKEDEEERVSSPYTKIKVNKYEVAPVVLGVIILLLIALVLYIVLRIVKNGSDSTRELMVMEDIYELTK